MTCWRLVDSVRPCAGAGRCNVCPTLAQRAQNSRFHAWTDVPYLLASSHTAILDRAAILIPEARNCMLCCDVVDQAYYAVSEKRSSKSAEIKSPSMGAGQKVGDKRCTLAGVVVHENAFCSGNGFALKWDPSPEVGPAAFMGSRPEGISLPLLFCNERTPEPCTANHAP